MSEKKKNEANTAVHLKSVRMAGFKNYLHPVGLELGKVNFLLGPNGAGKSSFLQSIELMGILSASKVLDGLALEDLSRFGKLRHESKGNIAGECRLAVTMGSGDETLDLEVTVEPWFHRILEWSMETNGAMIKLGRGDDGQWNMRHLDKRCAKGLMSSSQAFLDELESIDGVRLVDDAQAVLCFSSFQETLDERKRGYMDIGARWPNPRVVAVKDDLVLCFTRNGHFVLASKDALSCDAWIETGRGEDGSLTKWSNPEIGLGTPETWARFFGVNQEQFERPSAELVSLSLNLHAYYMHLGNVDVLSLSTKCLNEDSYPWQMAWMEWARDGVSKVYGGRPYRKLLAAFMEGRLSKDVYRDFPFGWRSWQGSKTLKAQSTLVYWLGPDGPFKQAMGEAMYSTGKGVSNDDAEADRIEAREVWKNSSDPLEGLEPYDPDCYEVQFEGGSEGRIFQGHESSFRLQDFLFSEKREKDNLAYELDQMVGLGIGSLIQNFGLEIHHIGPDVERDFDTGSSVFDRGEVRPKQKNEEGLISWWIPQGELMSYLEHSDRAENGFKVLAKATKKFGWGEVKLETKGARRVMMIPVSVQTDKKVQDTRTWYQGGSIRRADDPGDFTRNSLEDWDKPMGDVPVPMKLQGRGVRQVVAVALHLIRIACDGKSGAKVVALEEPTAFLHPRLASEFTGLIRELADVLGLTIIIETHNEYMIRQLSTDRLNGDTLEDVRIHYVGAQGDDYVLPIRVDRDGVFNPGIPEGFLDKSSAMQREQRQLKKKRGK